MNYKSNINKIMKIIKSINDIFYYKNDLLGIKIKLKD